MFNDDGSIDEDELRAKLRELMEKDEIEEQIALLEIEARLARGDTVWAASQLRCFRREVPRWDGRPDLFDTLIEEDPLAAGKVLETRALVYRDAGLLPEAQKDFVRSMLVAGDELSAGRVLSVFADLEGVELEPWMRKALAAVTARFGGDAGAPRGDPGRAARALLVRGARPQPGGLGLRGRALRAPPGGASRAALGGRAARARDRCRGPGRAGRGRGRGAAGSRRRRARGAGRGPRRCLTARPSGLRVSEYLVERRGCQHLVEPTLDVGRRGIPDPLTRGLGHVPELLPELTKECLAESGEVAFDSPLLLKLIPRARHDTFSCCENSVDLLADGSQLEVTHLHYIGEDQIDSIGAGG